MAKTVNFLEDLPKIRRYIAKRVRAQRRIVSPISAIEAGIKLNQSGHFVLNFDERAIHKRDGTWTNALDDESVALRHWYRAYDRSEEYSITFTLLSGRTVRLRAGAGDKTIARVFGMALLAILQDAIAGGAFLGPAIA